MSVLKGTGYSSLASGGMKGKEPIEIVNFVSSEFIYLAHPKSVSFATNPLLNNSIF